MNIDLKEEVRRAVAMEWSAFAARHPNLAGVLDERLLVDGAMQNLGDDPEYLEAMTTASSIGAGAEVVTGIIERCVRRWLWKLV
ncbi:MAG: hypothetical protein ABIP55_14190 [Tepidisphaeraceae bacterium]